MPTGARRLLLRLWSCHARRALRLSRLWLAALALAVTGPAMVAASDTITGAHYSEPTTRYGHGVLGDDVEWGALVLATSQGQITIRLPQSRVFEDTAPRLITGDRGAPLAMVIETDTSRGARLSLYNAAGLYAATPYIGRTHRWLAPLGAADLDGDGWPEIAYVDRPHLAKTLRIWRLKDGKLTEIAAQPGLTNHRIGEDNISGGIRNCGSGPEIISASANWSRLIASTLKNGQITTRDIGPHTGPNSFENALDCR